jgi:hypothetical protein
MENLDPNVPKSPENLFGSNAADVILGIVAGILWWVAGCVVASCCRHTNTGLIVTCVIAVFLIQVVAVGVGRRGAGTFVVSEVITVLLTPLIALGLLFGACLLGGMKM